MQKLIYNFKYKPYLTDLKNVLADLFYESIIQSEQFQSQIKKGEWVFVPIPLSDAKLRKRGYNQAEILATELSKKFNFPAQNLLERTKETKTQVGLSNIARKINIKNAFELNTKYSIRNTNVFLVDDVVTTGSTLLEAAKILKKAGAQAIFGLTLARDWLSPCQFYSNTAHAAFNGGQAIKTDLIRLSAYCGKQIPNLILDIFQILRL